MEGVQPALAAGGEAGPVPDFNDLGFAELGLEVGVIGQLPFLH